ncbi:exosortase-associated EpsI family protein [Oleiharenicola lentus]|uniref:exosortase-associated EpsI family protein n=1 Tax=Oleiharenicola lentus TaxID=2508720 RepID=UPI003F681F45
MGVNKFIRFGWLGVAAFCLVTALSVIVFFGPGEAPPDAHEPLAKRLPKDINGWVGEDLPLGTMEALEASQRILNYDDYVYRVYRKASQEVFLYAMFWKQGSISIREIAGHTPDGCWIANGARFNSGRETRRLQVGVQLTVPAEAREFVFPNNQPVSAVWWHFWGNELVDRSFDRKSLLPTLREMWVWLVRRKGQRQDQLLVRIHAPSFGEEFLKQEPVQIFLGQFPAVFSAESI